MASRCGIIDLRTREVNRKRRNRASIVRGITGAKLRDAA